MLISSAIKPTQIKTIFANFRKGKELGKQTNCLLVYQFEENWARPIADLRSELGLVLEDEQLEGQPNKATAKILSKEGVAV